MPALQLLDIRDNPLSHLFNVLPSLREVINQGGEVTLKHIRRELDDVKSRYTMKLMFVGNGNSPSRDHFLFSC